MGCELKKTKIVEYNILCKQCVLLSYNSVLISDFQQEVSLKESKINYRKKRRFYGKTYGVI